jgi:acetyl-CoA carboxylase carboxyl transferase subunit alpha
MDTFFDFEKPIVALEKKLEELREIAGSDGVDLSREIKTLQKKLETLIKDTYAELTTWQRVQLSRHPSRPYTLDYWEAIFPDFQELHGDRAFGDHGSSKRPKHETKSRAKFWHGETRRLSKSDSPFSTG